MKSRLLILKIFFTFLFVIFVLTSCAPNKEVKKQEKNSSFEYLNVFGGVLFDALGRVFSLKDGTFYVIAETYSPASAGDIPKSCNFKIHNLPNISNLEMEDCGDIWIFQIDPRKEDGKQIIYSRCFGGTKGEGVMSVAITEDEQIVVFAVSNSDDGDLANEQIKGNKRWIFRVDPKRTWKEQITYSNSFNFSDFNVVNDIKFASKDIAYLYSNRKYQDGFMYNLKVIDLSKDRENSQIFNRDIFFTDIQLVRDAPILTKNKMVIGDNGILTITISAVKDHLFMPNDIKKALNVNRTTSYKENKSKDDKKIKKRGIEADILVLSLNPKLSESDWILFSRFIGGNNNDFMPSILKAKNEKYWISFFSTSCDGELKGIKSTDKDKKYSNMVLLKLNPNNSFDKQIEYLRYFSLPKDEALGGLYSFAKDENDNIAFIANNLKRIKTKDDDNGNIVLENKDYDREKNVVFPYVEDERFHKSYKLFYIDTKKDEVFYKDLYVLIDTCYALDFYDNSSLVFAMSTNSKPNVGDMPNYKISVLENWINKKSSLDENFYSNILIGILPIKNMKKLEKEK